MVVTLRDVASASGVSSSTVSRSFTTPELVNRQTLKRVREVATRLRYEPNRAAQELVTGRTSNIGIIVPDLANLFFPEIIKGAQNRAREAGHFAFLADSAEDPKAEYDLVVQLSGRVDGVILCSSRMTASQMRSLEDKTRFVLINRESVGTPTVFMDAASGAQQVAEHLVALGHRSIAYLAGPAVSWSNRERRRAIRSYLKRAGTQLVQFGPFLHTFEAGVQGADVAVAHGASAIIAFNDLMAFGVLSRLLARRIAVPDDISLVGFDDIPMAMMTTPALTTVAVPKEEAGRAAVDLLLASLGEEPVVNKRLPGQLIVRGSTGPFKRL